MINIGQATLNKIDLAQPAGMSRSTPALLAPVRQAVMRTSVAGREVTAVLLSDNRRAGHGGMWLRRRSDHLPHGEPAAGSALHHDREWHHPRSGRRHGRPCRRDGHPCGNGTDLNRSSALGTDAHIDVDGFAVLVLLPCPVEASEDARVTVDTRQVVTVAGTGGRCMFCGQGWCAPGQQQYSYQSTTGRDNGGSRHGVIVANNRPPRGGFARRDGLLNEFQLVWPDEA